MSTALYNTEFGHSFAFFFMDCVSVFLSFLPSLLLLLCCFVVIFVLDNVFVAARDLFPCPGNFNFFSRRKQASTESRCSI